MNDKMITKKINSNAHRIIKLSQACMSLLRTLCIHCISPVSIPFTRALRGMTTHENGKYINNVPLNNGRRQMEY